MTDLQTTISTSRHDDVERRSNLAVESLIGQIKCAAHEARLFMPEAQIRKLAADALTAVFLVPLAGA